MSIRILVEAIMKINQQIIICNRNQRSKRKIAIGWLMTRSIANLLNFKITLLLQNQLYRRNCKRCKHHNKLLSKKTIWNTQKAYRILQTAEVAAVFHYYNSLFNNWCNPHKWKFLLNRCFLSTEVQK